jgi:UDP-sugar transporter A1/2/3
VWTITLSAALGGFLVSAVMKYADNVQKTYAQSVAIVLTAIGSTLFLDFIPTGLTSFGMTLVLVSVYVYSVYPPARSIKRASSDGKMNDV